MVFRAFGTGRQTFQTWRAGGDEPFVPYFSVLRDLAHGGDSGMS